MPGQRSTGFILTLVAVAVPAWDVKMSTVLVGRKVGDRAASSKDERRKKMKGSARTSTAESELPHLPPALRLGECSSMPCRHFHVKPKTCGNTAGRPYSKCVHCVIGLEPKERWWGTFHRSPPTRDKANVLGFFQSCVGREEGGFSNLCRSASSRCCLVVFRIVLILFPSHIFVCRKCMELEYNPKHLGVIFQRSSSSRCRTSTQRGLRRCMGRYHC